jgi:hypothetical protein
MPAGPSILIAIPVITVAIAIITIAVVAIAVPGTAVRIPVPTRNSIRMGSIEFPAGRRQIVAQR